MSCRVGRPRARAVYGSRREVISRERYADDLVHNDVESRVAEKLDSFAKRHKTGDCLSLFEETEYVLSAGRFLFDHYACSDRDEQREVYKKYLAEVEGVFDEANAKHQIGCNACNNGGLLLMNDGDYVCTSCHNIEPGPSTYSKADFETNPPPRPQRQQLYQPINHFNEMLIYFQGLEMTEIPSDVIQYVAKEAVEHYPMERVTHVHVKQLLQVKKLNKYYRNIPTILHQALGINPPIFSVDQIGILRKMFLDTQSAFRLLSSSRINFLSISYLLFKYCELMNWTEYLALIPLLKSPLKLLEHDDAWLSICKSIGWAFVKTRHVPRCLIG